MSLARLRNDSWSESECLNEADRIVMDLPFTDDEVKDVIDQMVSLLNFTKLSGK
jgi:hypothetical protein